MCAGNSAFNILIIHAIWEILHQLFIFKWKQADCYNWHCKTTIEKITKEVVHMPNKKCMSMKHDTQNLRSMVKITAWQSTNNRQKVDSVK